MKFLPQESRKKRLHFPPSERKEIITIAGINKIEDTKKKKNRENEKSEKLIFGED